LLHTRGHHTSDASTEVSPLAESNGHEPIAATSPVVTLTEEELQQRISRQAQSLHDRDVARRNKEAQEAERKRLRDEDPWSYAQEEKQREDTEQQRQVQTAQLMTLLGHVGRQHDAATLDPLIHALSDTERERILALPNAGQGLPGRKIIADEALKSFARQEYERGYRDAQAKLKRDPVFRKSVLAEHRGSFDEPELYSGNGSPSEGLPEDNVSSVLRRQYFSR